MRFPRSAGVLLHVTSLPGDFGIGDLGPRARGFIDFLAAAGQSYWQLLPLGPTDDGSPYVAQSSWAGSPLLLSLEALRDAGDLTDDELESARRAPERHADFLDVRRAREGLIARAAARFHGRHRGEEHERFVSFCRREWPWLESWALFAALKHRFDGAPWWTWPAEYALRHPDALARTGAELATELGAHRYAQFRFFEQWTALRAYAAHKGIALIGDVPIYCARDSADVWASRQIFQLDAEGRPLAVSGVPPDYFAEDGQLWGTPVYDWSACHAEGYAWWIERLRAALRQTDIVRIDHFRAFEAYWAVPADAATAKGGRWVAGPGDAFFAAVRAALGEPPFIAEDLGIITRAVRELRDRWSLPGMRVLQFGFGDGGINPHLPPYHVPACVAYTGTHDNDTTVGWFEKAGEKERDLFRRYTASSGDFCHYHMIRALYASCADLAVVPMQDVLGQGSWARMNTPGLASGNWGYKLAPEDLTPEACAMLRELAATFGRLPEQIDARRKRDAEETDTAVE